MNNSSERHCVEIVPQTHFNLRQATLPSRNVISLRDVIKKVNARAYLWMMRETNIDIRSWPQAHHTIIPLAIIAHTKQPLPIAELSWKFFIKEFRRETRRNCWGMWADGNSISRCVFNLCSFVWDFLILFGTSLSIFYWVQHWKNFLWVSPK